MNFIERNIEKIEKRRIHKEINLFQDLIDGYKVHLYDIEHDLMDDSSFDIVKIGAGVDTREEYVDYAIKQIELFSKRVKSLYFELAKYSKWQPPKRISVLDENGLPYYSNHAERLTKSSQ